MNTMPTMNNKAPTPAETNPFALTLSIMYGTYVGPAKINSIDNIMNDTFVNFEYVSTFKFSFVSVTLTPP